MRLLELFSGTGSVGTVAKELGFDVISLDRDMPADIQTDIMDWVPLIPRKHFDVIWASPPCTEYSCAKTVGTRDIEGANKVVDRTLQIIEYFEPKYFIIENPQTGLLKQQIIMYGLPFKDVDYCKYGLSYRKRTRLWNNVFNWKPRPLCKADCGKIREGSKRKHVEVAQRGPHSGDTGRAFKQAELYRVPGELVREIFEAILDSGLGVSNI
jgi:C-5 cytosine-specific DNA methylase